MAVGKSDLGILGDLAVALGIFTPGGSPDPDWFSDPAAVAEEDAVERRSAARADRVRRCRARRRRPHDRRRRDLVADGGRRRSAARLRAHHRRGPARRPARGRGRARAHGGAGTGVEHHARDSALSRQEGRRARGDRAAAAGHQRRPHPPRHARSRSMPRPRCRGRRGSAASASRSTFPPARADPNQPLFALALAGLQLPGASAPRDLRVAADSADQLDDAVLELVLGLVKAQADAAGAPPAIAALGGLLGLKSGDAVLDFPIAELRGAGPDRARPLGARHLHATRRAAPTGSPTSRSLLGAAPGSDRVSFTLGSAAVVLGLKLDTGPSGNPRLTPTLGVELGNATARVQAAADLFRIDLVSGAAVALPSLGVWAAAGRRGEPRARRDGADRRARRHAARRLRPRPAAQARVRARRRRRAARQPQLPDARPHLARCGDGRGRQHRRRHRQPTARRPRRRARRRAPTARARRAGRRHRHHAAGADGRSRRCGGRLLAAARRACRRRRAPCSASCAPRSPMPPKRLRCVQGAGSEADPWRLRADRAAAARGVRQSASRLHVGPGRADERRHARRRLHRRRHALRGAHRDARLRRAQRRPAAGGGGGARRARTRREPTAGAPRARAAASRCAPITWGCASPGHRPRS